MNEEVPEVELKSEEDIEKIYDLGTVYHRDNKIVVATTVGIVEGETKTKDVDEHRVNFVFYHTN